jgi:heme/copper-type cytochrome/quinol oxidase subunit 2
MQSGLTIALYVVIGILFVVLAIGIGNLIRTDANARSRSNHLMRLRVAVQAVAVLIIVILGFVSGAFH